MLLAQMRQEASSLSCRKIYTQGTVSYTHLNDFLNNYIFSEAQCPQGICITDEYVLITSYSDDKGSLGELMVFEYAQLKGTLDGMDTTVITELSEYGEKELGYVQPSRTPFVVRNFNVTRAGIHADGLLKNE